MQRPFAPGSRQAPDPYDQYLEEKGFYRKHTARDSSSLFRVVSEQIYGAQIYHLKVRRNCVEYIHQYKKIINEEVEDYIKDLSKTKTHGSLEELRYLAYLYRHNVILFEPLSTGKWFVKEKKFNGIIRIFIARDNHFDSVFTKKYTENLAFCQSIVYETLYKKVFKLPDIKYAVEKMLYGNSLENVKGKFEYNGPYLKKLVLDDGRIFDFDGPENTSCILNNNLLCKFHSLDFENFEAKEESCELNINEKSKGKLHKKYLSCIQQLLEQGITPFPYKVAKALDPDIYHNTEFDVWAEERREIRFIEWYKRGGAFQIGAKCLVKLRRSQSNLYSCYIQEISSKEEPVYVYIEELGERYIVPYDFLEPIPLNLREIKHWSNILCFQRQRKNKKNRFCAFKKRFYNKKLNKNDFYSSVFGNFMNFKNNIFMIDENDTFNCCNNKNLIYKLKEFTSLENFDSFSYNIIAMPLTINENENNLEKKYNMKNSFCNAGFSENSKNEMNKAEYYASGNNENCALPEYSLNNNSYPEQIYSTYHNNNNMSCINGPHSMLPSNTIAPYYCMYNSSYSGPNHQSGVYLQPPLPCFPQVSGGFYNNSFYQHSPYGSNINETNLASLNAGCFREPLLEALVPETIGQINLNAKKSVLRSGSDLPTDIPTLQYFFNLGVEHFKQTQDSKKSCSLNEKKDCNEIKKLTEECQSKLKLDENEENSKGEKKADLTENGRNYQSSRRFHSRYFNNRKDYKIFRGPNSNANIQKNFDLHKNDKKISNNVNDSEKNKNFDNNIAASTTFENEWMPNSLQFNNGQNSVNPTSNTYMYCTEQDQNVNNGNNLQSSIFPPAMSCNVIPPTISPRPQMIQNNGYPHGVIGPNFMQNQPPIQLLSSYSSPFYASNHEIPFSAFGAESGIDNSFTLVNCTSYYYPLNNGSVNGPPSNSGGYWYHPTPQNAFAQPVINQGNSTATKTPNFNKELN